MHKKEVTAYLQHFFSQRNQIAFLVRLLSWASSISSTDCLLTHIWSLWVLVLRWGIAVTAEATIKGQLLPLPLPEIFSTVLKSKNYASLYSLLRHDNEVLTRQLGELMPLFEEQMRRVAAR